MAFAQERTVGDSGAHSQVTSFSPRTVRAEQMSQPTRLRLWLQTHRPPYQLTEHSWFVMLTAVCLGIAMVFAPMVFVTLAVAFGCTAWWRRESARQGIITVAFLALAAGLVLTVFSIVGYIIGNI